MKPPIAYGEEIQPNLFYKFNNGWYAKRKGKGGPWELFNERNERIDVNRYRTDLFQKHNLKIR